MKLYYFKNVVGCNGCKYIKISELETLIYFIKIFHYKSISLLSTLNAFRSLLKHYKIYSIDASK